VLSTPASLIERVSAMPMFNFPFRHGGGHGVLAR
jgi:hypothetical protein